jgi:hypothetical protein
MVGLLYDPTQPMSLIEKVNHPAWMGVKPTLGQRNNNWGNLRTWDDFEGKTGTNKSYDTYETPEKGLRALARVLDTYSSKHGINTIDALINKYAPASDNTGGSHENYKKALSQRLGVGINDPIDVKALRPEIMDAIIKFENKNRPLASPEMLQQAINDADGTKETKNMMAQSFSGNSFLDESYTPPPMNTVTLPDQNSDGYGLMRQRNYTEAEINEAKKAGIRPEMFPEKPKMEYPAAISGNAALDEGAAFDTTPPPALMNTTPDNAVDLPQSGILSTPANAATIKASAPNYQSMLPPEPAMMTSPVSGQRRDQSAMSFPPMIDKYDMAIRVGGRGMAAASKGGLAAYGAMADEYGDIQNINNKSALEIYKAALKGDAKSAKALQENQAQIGQIDQTIFDMDRALQNLESKDMSLTGWWDSTVGKAWDNFRGNPEAAARLLLQKLRVDDTLLRVAQTKGAISNKEMDLFMSPAPSDMADEKVWIQWIKDRKEAIQRVRNRLAGGQTVDPSQQASTSQINAFGSSQTVVSPNVAAARKALTQ